MQFPLHAGLLFQSEFSIHSLFTNLPTDPPSLFVLGLLVAGVVGIVWTGRGKGGPS